MKNLPPWMSTKLDGNLVNNYCDSDERKGHGITKVSRIDPLGTMNVCTKFNLSPPSSLYVAGLPRSFSVNLRAMSCRYLSWHS